ncbi:hypothetical protein GVAV_002605, partial [Gurleya vavrai]
THNCKHLISHFEEIINKYATDSYVINSYLPEPILKTCLHLLILSYKEQKEICSEDYEINKRGLKVIQKYVFVSVIFKILYNNLSKKDAVAPIFDLLIDNFLQVSANQKEFDISVLCIEIEKIYNLY